MSDDDASQALKLRRPDHGNAAGEAEENKEESADSLSDMLASAVARYRANKDTELAPNDPKRSEQAEATIMALMRLLKMSRQASVVSDNEEIDDVPTSSLGFVLLPFMLGDTALSMPGFDQDKRLRYVTMGMAYIKMFLASAERLKVMDEADKARYDGKTLQQSMTMQQRRQAKIDEAKRQMANRKRIEHLEALKRKRKGVDAATVDDDWEEQERELLLLQIREAVRESLSLIDMHARELELLKHGARMRREAAEQGRHKGSSNDNNDSSSLSRGQQQQSQQQQQKKKDTKVLHFASANKPPVAMSLSQMATMEQQINRRANARAHVFRDPNPATISIEEALELDIQSGKIPQEALDYAKNQAIAESRAQWARHRVSGRLQAEREAAENKHEAGEDEEDEDALAIEYDTGDSSKVDAKTLKDREWDAWKDDHEKGAGKKGLYHN